MRDYMDMYGAWFFIFGFPVVCFIIAMLTGCGPPPRYTYNACVDVLVKNNEPFRETAEELCNESYPDKYKDER